MEQNREMVVALLNDLRASNFGIHAWGRFLVRSWGMALATARTHPALRCSWLLVTVLISTIALGMLVATGSLEGRGSLLRLMPGFTFCVAWQQCDLFWHLGLNRNSQTGKMYSRIGLANILTWLRALGASYLIGRLTGGLATPSWLVLSVFLFGVLTDILDGVVARQTRTQSVLGQVTDSEVDFCLYLAVTIMLVQNAVLPIWLGAVMLLRFVIPFLAVVCCYFLLARPIRFGSTTLGKYTGLCQCLYFLVVLAPTSLAFVTQFVQLPLLILTLALLVTAPIAQWAKVRDV